MGSVRRGVAALVTSLVVGLGAGCSDPEPNIGPASESPAPSVSETASPEAAPWEEKSRKGAVAFAEHWIQTLSVAMSDPSTDAIRELSDPACELCMDFADRLDRIRDGGGFYRSAGWRVLQAVPRKGLPSNRASVALRIRAASEIFREGGDSSVTRNPGFTATWTSEMKWLDDGWLLTKLELEE